MVTPSASMGFAPPHGGRDVHIVLQHDKHERSIQVHYPEAYYTEGDRKLPLIVAFHGKRQRAETFAIETGLSDSGINSEFLVVYPHGVNNQWMGDPESPPLNEINDPEFISHLLDHLCRDYPVDPDRIFLLGFSNGAGLAALIACDRRLSRRIRAVAMAASAIYLDDARPEPLFGKFDSSRFPIPLLEFHGDADPVIDYNGVDTPDGPSWPIGDWLRGYTWMMEKGMNDGEVIHEEAEEEILYDGTVERYAWHCGTDHEIVVHYLIHGFGHGWPTTTPLDNDELRHGPTVFDATPIALEFFREAAKIKPFHINWDDG